MDKTVIIINWWRKGNVFTFQIYNNASVDTITGWEARAFDKLFKRLYAITDTKLIIINQLNIFSKNARCWYEMQERRKLRWYEKGDGTEIFSLTIGVFHFHDYWKLCHTTPKTIDEMVHTLQEADRVGINIHSITIGAFAWKDIIDSIGGPKLFHWIFRPMKRDVENIVRQAHYGGLIYCDYNDFGQIHNDVTSVDFNSLYPHILSTARTPRDAATVFKGEAEPHNTWFMIYRFKVTGLQLKRRKIPHIRYNDGTGEFVIHEPGELLYSLSKHDFARLKQNYTWTKLVVHETYVWGTQAASLFKPWVDKWYAIKNNATTPQERQFAKILLNSAYGKFIQRRHQTRVDQEGNSSLFITNKRLAPPVAINITDIARKRLLDLIDIIGRANFIYCDTDGVKFRDPEGKILMKLKRRGLIGDEVGKLKVEFERCRFVALRPKCWAVEYKDGTVNRVASGFDFPDDKYFKLEDFCYNKVMERSKPNIVKCKFGYDMVRLDAYIQRPRQW